MHVKDIYEGLKEYQALEDLRENLKGQRARVNGGGHDDVPEAMREEIAEMYNRQIALVTEKQASMVFESVRKVMLASDRVDLPPLPTAQIQTPAPQLTPEVVFKDISIPAVKPPLSASEMRPPLQDPMGSAPNSDVDTSGETWSPKKHATPASKTVKGLWKKRKGYKTADAALADIPDGVAIKDVMDSVYDPLVSPAPPQPKVVSYDTLVAAVSKRFGSGVISVEAFGKLCADLRFEYLSSIEDNPELIKSTYDRLLEEYPNETQSV